VGSAWKILPVITHLTKTEIFAGGEQKKEKRSKVIIYGNNQTDGANKKKPRWFQRKEPK